MARLFISHSSKDNAQAAAIGDWLTREGFDDFFLDFDADRGIAAGERWERALHQAADRCEAVVFLVSRAWLASDWCAREFDLAAKLSKRIFGVVIDNLAVDDVPARYRRAWQFVSLASGGDHDLFRVKVPPFGEEQHVTFSRDGLKRLKAGLFAAGLDPRHFAWPPEGDPGRSPYPGLAALEAEDAGIFFGREAPLVLALDKIRDLAGRAPPRLLAILGASGAGKSSFLRAGLWPRLARDDRHFLPLPVIRPMERAISGDKGLVAALDKACTARGLRLSRAEIAEATTDIAALVALLGRLAAAALVPPLPGEGDASPPALVLAVDQAEELFPLEDRPEAARLLDLLAVLAQSNALTVIIVFTIRTESYELLQSAAASKDLKQEPFSLQPVPRGAFQTIIEGPAARLAKTRRPLIVDPALTEALMRDIEASGGRDALPLLAFTLERLYLDHGGKGSLKLADYHASGGVAGSITAAVEKALELAGRDGSVPPGRDERLALLRRGLIPWLASIDPTTGEPRRASAPRTALPAETLPLIDRLIEMRLLRTDEAVAHDRAAASVEVPTMTAAVPIEPAHEALLRQWPVMVGWLAEDKALLAALAGVRQATRDWVEHGRDPRWLAHAAGRLEDAEALLQRSDLAAGLDADHRDYLTSARAAEDGRRNAEIEQARRIAEAAEAARAAAEHAAMAEARGKRRARIGAVVAAGFAAAAASGAWFGLDQAGKAEILRRTAEDQRDRADRALMAATETAGGLVNKLAGKFRNRMGIEVKLVQDILNEARLLQQKLLSNGQEISPNLRRNSALALREVAITLMEAGDISGARNAMEEARALQEELMYSEPHNTKYQSDINISYDTLGQLAMVAGDLTSAQNWFEKGLIISQMISDKDPENIKYRRGLSFSFERIGEVAWELSDIDAAQMWFEKSLLMRQNIIDAGAFDDDLFYELSSLVRRLGDVAMARGDVKTAQRWFEKSLNVSESLVKRDGGNATLQRNLSLALSKLGELALYMRDLKGAQECFKRQQVVAKSLARSVPDNADYKHDLYTINIRLASISAELRDGTEGEMYKEGLSTIIELNLLDPNNIIYKKNLQQTYYLLGIYYMQTNELEFSKNMLENSLDHAGRLVNASPSSIEHQQRLANSYQALGELAELMGDLKVAREWIGKRLAITRGQMKTNPDNADIQRSVAMSLIYLGKIASKDNELKSAQEAFRTANDILKQISGSHPSNNQFQQDLSMSFAMLGFSEFMANNNIVALEYIDGSLDLLQRLFANGTDSSVFSSKYQYIIDETEKIVKSKNDGKLTTAWQEKIAAVRRRSVEHIHTDRTAAAVDKMPDSFEVEVQRVIAGSVAEKIGLQPGDRLLTYASEKLINIRQLVELTGRAETTVRELSYRRGGQVFTIDVPAGRLGAVIENMPAVDLPTQAPP